MCVWSGRVFVLSSSCGVCCEIVCKLHTCVCVCVCAPARKGPGVCEPLVLLRLAQLEEDIISCHAGLVILDSVASVVRKEFDTSLSGNLTHRSNLLGREAATLKYLAQEFRIPVSVLMCLFRILVIYLSTYLFIY